jgi:thiol-disulfide isomerase/thioredoxin
MVHMRGSCRSCDWLQAAVTVGLALVLLLVAAACSGPAESRAEATSGVAQAAPAVVSSEAVDQPTAVPGVVTEDEPGALEADTSSEITPGPLVRAEAAPSGGPAVTEEAAAEPALEGAKLPRLIDLGANKCIPCKKMAPILEELAETHKAFFSVEVIDVWVNPDQGKKYNVRIIPTQIFYDAQGKERYRHIGFYSKEDILSKWRELGVDVGS